VFKKILLHMATLLLTFIMLFSAFNCGGVETLKGPDALPGKLLINISQARTDTERLTAIKNVLCQGLSLGFTDEKGNQLNRNISKDAVSLTAEDMAVLNSYIKEKQGYTIAEVVEFLAAAGVKLASTEKVITTKDILPDIQKYVNWSYAYRDDVKSLLGLALASGADMQIAGTAPKFQANTVISTTASLMMLADILIGVPMEKRVSSHRFIKAAYAADTKELAEKVEGLLTIVETGALLTDKGEQMDTSEVAMNLIKSFAAGSRLSVRIVWMESESYSSLNKSSVVQSIELSSYVQKKISLGVILILMPSGEKLLDVPVTYTLNLLGPTSAFTGQTGPLFPDADAKLETELRASSLEFDGHRLGIKNTPPNITEFAVRPNNLSNTARRIAMLHASAQVNFAELKLAAAQKPNELGAISPLIDELQTAYVKMQQSIKVASWMSEVIIMPAAYEVNIEPREMTGEINQKYTFRALLKDNKPLPVQGLIMLWEIDFITPEKREVYDSASFSQKTDFEYTFTKTGTYEITCTVRDASGTMIDSTPAKVVIKPKSTSGISLDIQTPALLESNIGLNFKAIPSVPLEQIPQNTAWKWDFDDGTPPYTRIGRTEVYLTATHPFAKNGTYNITLSLVDRTSDQVYATTTKKITIDDSASLSKTNRISTSLYVYGKVEGDGPGFGLTLKGFGHGFYQQPPLQTFQWPSATSFKGTWQQTSTTSRGVQTNTHELQGTISVSSQEIKITSYTYTHTFSSPDYEGPGKGWKYTENVVLKDIPLTKINGGDAPKYTAKIQGKDLAQYVVQTSREEFFANGQKTFFNQAIWDNIPQGIVPILEITIDYAR
jgi:PKD repeat protein